MSGEEHEPNAPHHRHRVAGINRVVGVRRRAASTDTSGPCDRIAYAYQYCRQHADSRADVNADADANLNTHAHTNPASVDD